MTNHNPAEQPNNIQDTAPTSTSVEGHDLYEHFDMPAVLPPEENQFKGIDRVDSEDQQSAKGSKKIIAGGAVAAVGLLGAGFVMGNSGGETAPAETDATPSMNEDVVDMGEIENPGDPVVVEAPEGVEVVQYDHSYRFEDVADFPGLAEAREQELERLTSELSANHEEIAAHVQEIISNRESNNGDDEILPGWRGVVTARYELGRVADDRYELNLTYRMEDPFRVVVDDKLYFAVFDETQNKFMSVEIGREDPETGRVTYTDAYYENVLSWGYADDDTSGMFTSFIPESYDAENGLLLVDNSDIALGRPDSTTRHGGWFSDLSSEIHADTTYDERTNEAYKFGVNAESDEWMESDNQAVLDIQSNR